MDQLMKSTVAAMDAIFGSTLPAAPRSDGECLVQDWPCHLRIEYRVNADDYCEAVRVFADFGGAMEVEVPIRCLKGTHLEELEALCGDDWDSQDDSPFARSPR